MFRQHNMKYVEKKRMKQTAKTLDTSTLPICSLSWQIISIWRSLEK